MASGATASVCLDSGDHAGHRLDTVVEDREMLLVFFVVNLVLDSPLLVDGRAV